MGPWGQGLRLSAESLGKSSTTCNVCLLCVSCLCHAYDADGCNLIESLKIVCCAVCVQGSEEQKQQLLLGMADNDWS